MRGSDASSVTSLGASDSVCMVESGALVPKLHQQQTESCMLAKTATGEMWSVPTWLLCTPHSSFSTWAWRRAPGLWTTSLGPDNSTGDPLGSDLDGHSGCQRIDSQVAPWGQPAGAVIIAAGAGCAQLQSKWSLPVGGHQAQGVSKYPSHSLHPCLSRNLIKYSSSPWLCLSKGNVKVPWGLTGVAKHCLGDNNESFGRNGLLKTTKCYLLILSSWHRGSKSHNFIDTLSDTKLLSRFFPFNLPLSAPHPLPLRLVLTCPMHSPL